MKNITSSKLQLVVVSFSFIVLGISFFLQYFKGLEPCPLCLMQRLCIISIFLLSFSSLIFNNLMQNKIVLRIQFVFVLAGLFFALRQLWLLSLPGDQIPACLPGLSVLIHYFPWQDTVHALFWGSGDCTKVKWTFLGLSLPLWSTLYFLFIGLMNSLIYYKLNHKK